ncbi:MAG: hypothetical protein QQN63_13630 [Nitrosopumilus sp.]
MTLEKQNEIDPIQPDPSAGKPVVTVAEPLEDSNSNSRESKEVYSTGVNIFDAVMKTEDIDKPVEDTWHWNRMNMAIPIRSLTDKEFKDLQDRFTIRKRIRRTNQVNTEIDIHPYNAAIVATACLDPNFSDTKVRKDFAAKFGMSPESESMDFVTRIFQIGERAGIAMAVLELTGFGEEEEEKVDTLKD